MSSVWLFRHQHCGFDSSIVFATKPTDEQMAALNAIADSRDRPGWAIAVEVELVIDGTVPVREINTTSGEPVNANEIAAKVGQYTMSAVGTVEEVAI
jgi:hypothetical protein